MVRQRNHQLDRLSKQLGFKLKRLIRRVQTCKPHHQLIYKEWAKREATILLNEYYLWATQHAEFSTRHDLHKSQIQPLSFADEQQLKLEVRDKYGEFVKILEDVT